MQVTDKIELKIQNMIVDTPTLNAYHPYFGKPYRALLYKFSRQSTYWIVYTMDHETINLVSFWHASLNPDALVNNA